jgi:hypothetical protein
LYTLLHAVPRVYTMPFRKYLILEVFVVVSPFPPIKESKNN